MDDLTNVGLMCRPHTTSAMLIQPKTNIYKCCPMAVYLRHWPNIKPALSLSTLFAGVVESTIYV